MPSLEYIMSWEVFPFCRVTVPSPFPEARAQMSQQLSLALSEQGK